MPGELKHQCEEVTERFELETRLWREERDQATRTIRDLNNKINQVRVWKSLFISVLICWNITGQKKHKKPGKLMVSTSTQTRNYQ